MATPQTVKQARCYGEGARAWRDAVPAPRALLLDLDDTILDDSSGVAAAWQTVCASAAQRLAGLDADHLNATIRTTAPDGVVTRGISACFTSR